MKPILIIKAGRTIRSIPASAGDFEHWIMNASGLEASAFRTVAVHLGESLPDPEDIAGALVTGSGAMVTDREDWSEYTAGYLRELVAGEVPLLGICYGHQLIAHALGGEVGWHPRGREIGTYDIRLLPAARQDPLFKSLPECFPAHTTHSQVILRLPEGSRILAGNDFDPRHGVRFARRAWGVQFHPEFTSPVMCAYIRERRADLEREGLDPDELLECVRDTPQAETLLPLFAGMVRAPS